MESTTYWAVSRARGRASTPRKGGGCSAPRPRLVPRGGGGRSGKRAISAPNKEVPAGDAIDELNERFRRAGVGYQFEDGGIFRVDSEWIHSEVVRLGLRYLHQKGFGGPREEFLKAHGHYRAGETKAAITDANNAFESTLKAILDQRGWPYSKDARASDLLKVVSAQGLLPGYLDNSSGQLAATLKSGLP